ncbi:MULTISPECIES: hypothetical protein [Dictyoglomus]|jgi:hypothetical protein|uniref:Uncharacterized protein n=1 Tax=Dictyoglomus turgidum (strain DSM 6724 / Z-1310) TaxID=515635 RepID=B8DYR0_DICTD|nr:MULTISPECIES: hypothetical protein [Dictyoglomus]ACK41442.1 hypothetical protein Dtur_0108 [Dictyoglomus turgidum DSM 6724]PNV79778.1 MAG: hypothetical protein C0196_04510 [Dictyoglomus turgidum]HBU31830.1 hypothetical protein [Dictyoglomus sp.]
MEKLLKITKDIFGPMTLKRPIRLLIQILVLFICSATILRIFVDIFSFIIIKLGTWTDKLLKLIGVGY